MPKKGKKDKITGTPDVVKFKGTPHFHMLKQTVDMQQTIPFVLSDDLDAQAVVTFARFLSYVGALGPWAAVVSNKQFRLSLCHKFISPLPHPNPQGYPVEIVSQARVCQGQDTMRLGGKKYDIPEVLKEQSVKFLTAVDTFTNRFAGVVESALKEDFARDGLKQFRADLRDVLQNFDDVWCAYERAYLTVMLDFHSDAFASVEALHACDARLTAAELEEDPVAKQREEAEFQALAGKLLGELKPSTLSDAPRASAVPLAEAALFYDKRMPPGFNDLAREVVRGYIELRCFVAELETSRLDTDLQACLPLVRCLQQFHEAVLNAEEVLVLVSSLPRLVHTKRHNWMSRALLLGEEQ